MASVNNSLVKKTQEAGITSYLNRMDVVANIDQALGKENRQRFITGIISAVNNNPQLEECTKKSILSGAILGETLKLSPSPQLGQYYLVPYNNKSGDMVAQFQLGYKGYIQLAIRSGQYKKLNVLAIKAGELIRFDPLNEEIEVKLIEDEEAREEAETIGYYAMFEYVNGFRKAIYWSKKKMLAHADKYSQAFSKNGCIVKTKKGEKIKKVSFAEYEAGNYLAGDAWLYSSFWYKDFDGMAYKTMLRQLISKWGIMSIDMISAMDADMAVINNDGTKDYVENDADDAVDAKGYEVEPEPESYTMEPEWPVQEAEGYGVQQALFGNV